MHQEIEIEFKHMLTLDEFHTLLKELPFPKEPLIQTNYYFETSTRTLIKKRCALRIRLKNDTYQCTFKEPHPQGVLETHDALSKEEAKRWMKGSFIHLPHISHRLTAHGIDVQDLFYIGSLTTKRYKYDMNGLQYVLDESSYGNTVDHELEIEAPSYEQGFHAYQQVVDGFQLSPQRSITKIERFFHEMFPR